MPDLGIKPESPVLEARLLATTTTMQDLILITTSANNFNYTSVLMQKYVNCFTQFNKAINFDYLIHMLITTMV